jgi:hypothetical protein
MQDDSLAASGMTRMAEGWLVQEREDFLFLYEHDPPRPYAYLRQLRDDARNWKPVAFWVVGSTLLAAGALSGQWVFALCGGLTLALWLWMFLRVARSLRHSPLRRGVVSKLEPHPLVSDQSTAHARSPDGEDTPVVVSTALAASVLDRDGRAEVLYLFEPRSQFSSVYAVRPCSEARPRPDEAVRRA